MNYRLLFGGKLITLTPSDDERSDITLHWSSWNLAHIPTVAFTYAPESLRSYLLHIAAIAAESFLSAA